ncbi:MAG: sensor histidine kinase [Pleurocapsa sp. SU_196_0]|nr:sensor histidine kinase [Pleurocapsa sp. SU_196_0]
MRQRRAVRRLERHLEVSDGALIIADDGPGLPASLEELTKPFNSQQVTLAGQSFTSGTGGLGLFIARRIVEAHGGTLEQLRSTTGTRLRLNLRGCDAAHHHRGRPPAVQNWVGIRPEKPGFRGRR